MIKLFQTSRAVVGSKFKLGGQSKSEGLDCLSMLFVFFEKAGIALPREFEGFKYEDYLEIYKRKDWAEIYLRFLRSLGESIALEKSMPGDIMIVEVENGITVGINAGNGEALFTTIGRVRKWSLNLVKVIEVIRCQFYHI